MKKARKSSSAKLQDKPAQFRLNKNLKDMSYEDAPVFIKKKIDKGRKAIAIAGLPK
jgi:hypothetical protein